MHKWNVLCEMMGVPIEWKIGCKEWNFKEKYYVIFYQFIIFKGWFYPCYFLMCVRSDQKDEWSSGWIFEPGIVLSVELWFKIKFSIDFNEFFVASAFLGGQILGRHFAGIKGLSTYNNWFVDECWWGFSSRLSKTTHEKFL